MINFSSDDIKNKAAEWSLNEDVKLLNKLKNLDELLSTKTREVLDNVNQTDHKVSNETISVKNLINDFYLLGHKQFTENQVEEEDVSKLYIENRSLTNEENSFKESIDQDSLIHEQMKSALNNSLMFVRAKMNILNQQDQELSEEANSNQQLEQLIYTSRYYDKRLPPVVNSDEFKNEVFNFVKQNSERIMVKKRVNSNQTEFRPSPLQSDAENISISEEISEINTNNFIDQISNKPQSTKSYDKVSQPPGSTVIFDSDSNRNPIESTFKLDSSQTHEQAKIESTNVKEHSVRRDLDAIFGKKATSSANDAKNRLFDEDDSDDKLFQPSTSQRAKRLSIDLFGSDSSIDSVESFINNKAINKQQTVNLFDCNTNYAAKAIVEPITTKPNDSAQISSQSISKKQNISVKLYESDSEDDQLFITKSLVQDNLFKPVVKEESKLIEQPVKESESLIESKSTLEQEKTSVIIDETAKVIVTDVQKSNEATSSSREKSFDDQSKMSSKKNLFKNQLEDLFAKKRNPNQGLIKVNREVENNESDNNKNVENDKKSTGSQLSIDSETNKSSIKIDHKKEFDLFSETPSSNDLFTADDLSSINTSTLDSNLIKTRIKPNNRKRPTKPRLMSSSRSDGMLSSQSKSSTEIKENLPKNVNDDINIPKGETDKQSNEIDMKSDTVVDNSKKVPKVVDTISKAVKKDNAVEIEKKTLFDESSDDEDFLSKMDNKRTLNETLDKKFKILFDSDEDEELFSKSSNEKSVSKVTTEEPTTLESTTRSETSTNEKLNEKLIKQTSRNQIKKDEKPARKTSIFDSESDDDLFFKK